MKIISQTTSRLVLEDRPWVAGVLSIGFILVFVGIGLSNLLKGEVASGLTFGLVGGGLGVLSFWAFVRRTQAILDRDTGTVTLRERSLSGFTETVHPLADIEGVEVESRRSDKSTTSRPVLRMAPGRSDGPIPLVAAYTGGAGAERAATAINDWLAQARPPTAQTVDSPPPPD